MILDAIHGLASRRSHVYDYTYLRSVYGGGYCAPRTVVRWRSLNLGVRHHRAMKTSRTIQFAVAAVLVSTGCGILLSDAAIGLATDMFLPSFICFLYWRTELSRPVAARELWIAVVVLAVLAAFVVLNGLFLPRSAGEHFVRQPVVVGAFWVVSMAALFWRWSRERRLTDA